MAKHYLSDEDQRELQEMLRWFKANKNRRERFRRRNIGGGGAGETASAILAAGGRVYEVQDSATGDGIYNCVKLQLESDNWADETSKDKFYLDGLKIWQADYRYAVDDIVLYSGSYYGCITEHVSQAGTPPPNDEFVKIWEWGYATVNWDDVTNYVVGDRRIYDVTGKHYLCIQNNINKIPPANRPYWKETYVADDYVYRTVSLTDHFFKCTTTHIAASNKQPPNTSYWESLFIVEVLNLKESDPTAETAVALVEGDRMAVWKTVDDEGTERYIGLPFDIKGTHIAYCKDDAGAGSTLDCYLDTDGTGDVIEVNFSIAQAGANLNAAVPRLEDGDAVFVRMIDASWWCVGAPFAPSEDI